MPTPGVYILLCTNNRYYIGSTNDVERRLSEHKAGRVTATRLLLPVELVLFHPCDTLTHARKTEYAVKKLKSKSLIERMIKEGRIEIAEKFKEGL
jgi:putative endonuclease